MISKRALILETPVGADTSLGLFHQLSCIPLRSRNRSCFINMCFLRRVFILQTPVISFKQKTRIQVNQYFLLLSYGYVLAMQTSRKDFLPTEVELQERNLKKEC